MTEVAPRIGFDRFIKQSWATTALDARAGQASVDDLAALLERDGLSVAARKKIRTVLNRLWLDPRAETAGFVDRGIALYQAGAPAVVLHWGVSIATYPFFAHVAGLVGRLTAIQGDCSASEVQRRMSERYGEREGTYRMTNMVLQSQADWGAISRVEGNKRLVRNAQSAVNGIELTGWLLEAAVRSTGKPVPAAAMASLPILYPFSLGESVGYSANANGHLELRSAGAGKELIALA